MIIPCILVLSFEFDFVWSTRYFPGVSCPQVLPCLALSYLDVYIKDYYLSLCPRLRVPVPPSCVHRDSSGFPKKKKKKHPTPKNNPIKLPNWLNPTSE